jgi:hypothetical protein
VKFGYDDFFFGQTALASVAGTPEFDFPGGLTIGAPYNLPSIEWQREFESRYELSWHKHTHDVKVGGEYLHVAHTGDWGILEAGRFNMSSIPPNLSALLPAGSALAPSTWNLAALNPYVLFYNQNFNQSGWQINVPRPEAALWFGDDWHLDRLSINYGVRWDDDFGVFSPPGVPVTTIAINNGVQSGISDTRQEFTITSISRRAVVSLTRWPPRSSSAAGVASTTVRRTPTFHTASRSSAKPLPERSCHPATVCVRTDHCSSPILHVG